MSESAAATAWRILGVCAFMGAVIVPGVFWLYAIWKTGDRG